MFDRIKAASTVQQAQLAVGGVCLLAGLLFALWFFVLRTEYEPLFTDLRMNDASTVVAALEQKKIPYRLTNRGTTILVPSALVDKTRLSVMDGEVPTKGTVGFELFNKADLGLTDFAQKINYMRALQGELERTIMTLTGVDSARVHLSLGEERLFRDDQVPPKASVTIRMAKGAVLPESLAQGVRRLVAAAVPKMNVSDVVILDEQGRAVGISTGLKSASSLSPVLQERQAVEEYYEGRIREALSISGFSEDISVEVSVGVYGTLPDASLLSNWAPASRSFPLVVTLYSVTALNAEMQEKARTLVGKTIASSSAQNDQIAFDEKPATMEPAAHPLSNIKPVPAAPAATAMWEDAESLSLLQIGIPVSIMVLVGLLFFRKLRGPRRLSPERREEFITRLRATLAERGGHVVPRV